MHVHMHVGMCTSISDCVPTITKRVCVFHTEMNMALTLFGINSSDAPFITPPDSTLPITTVPMS